jgi:hypothetical protein
LLLILSAAPVFAQGTDYNKYEFYVGYSHNRVDVGAVEDIGDDDPDFDDLNDIFNERQGFHGFNASVTGNLTRYVGLKFDYSYHQKSIGNEVDNTTARLHNFVGGIQIKDNSKATKIKPFAHALFGFARYALDLTELDDNIADFDEAGFSAVIGGGLDIRVHPRVDLRVIQFDWNPTRFDFRDFGGPVGGPITPTPTGEFTRTLHNFRIGFGAAFH